MTSHDAPRPARQTPTSNPVFAAILRYGLLLMLLIAVVGGVLGALFAGVPGLLSALVGTGMAAVFMAITAASILLANRFAGSELFVGAFFGIVMGGWLVKFAVFLVLVIVLKGAPWVSPLAMFLSIVAGVIGSLVVDVVVVARTRLSSASDVSLPGPESLDDDGDER